MIIHSVIAFAGTIEFPGSSRYLDTKIMSLAFIDPITLDIKLVF